MKPDRLEIDAEIDKTLDQIQVISEQLKEDIERLRDLRAQYDRCLKNAPVRMRIDRCNELFKKATILKGEHDKMVAEQRKLLDRLHELRQMRKQF